METIYESDTLAFGVSIDEHGNANVRVEYENPDVGDSNVRIPKHVRDELADAIRTE